MNLDTLITKLKGNKKELPVGVERFHDVPNTGIILDYFSITGLTPNSNKLEIVAPFSNAPHTNVGSLLNKLEQIKRETDEKTTGVSARVDIRGVELDITDVINYSNFYVVLRGMPKSH